METPINSPELGFTLSPKPQRVNANRELFILWVNRIHPILKTFCKTFYYHHEFDSSGRLHFHGVLYPYDMIKFKKCSSSLRQLGFVKYETKFKDRDKWMEYICKSNEETYQIYGNVPKEWLRVSQDTIKLIKATLKAESQIKSTGWFQTK